MERQNQLIFLLLAMTMHVLYAPAQQIVFAYGSNWSACPVQMIDSIKIMQPPMIDVSIKDKTIAVQADSILLNRSVPDTLNIQFFNDSVIIQNPQMDMIHTVTNSADVTVTSTGHRPFVCMVTGSSNNRCLVIDSDTTFTLVLAGLVLSSQKAGAICMSQKHKARIVIADGSFNMLSDAAFYQTDSADTPNGCLYAKGSLTFTGSGTLCVTGNRHHAISSGKNVKMEGGTIKLRIDADASKGIKCKKDFIMTGGRIEGEATGNVVIENGETSYCSLMKVGGIFQMDGGEITMRHQGDGGRCISVDGNMTMTAGTMDLECHGNGGGYLTANNDSDYYTPKCITVDDSLHIIGGTIRCTSTGLGGKGIVAGKYISVGEDKDNGPTIIVETKGECIVNNVDEDMRSGCPKGIKTGKELCIYGGDITVSTAGMGGEGLESNGTTFVYGGTLECNTFDDGINVADSIEIAGGHVYCCSEDNDGIDSNGSITISGGIVASVNQKKPNESLDSEGGQLRLLGGTVFGIGSAPVKVQQATCPYYSTMYEELEAHIGGLILSERKYIYVMHGDNVIMAMKNENRAFRAFLTVTSPSLCDNEKYVICEGEPPQTPSCTFFDGNLFIGGQPNCVYPITSIQVLTKQDLQ